MSKNVFINSNAEDFKKRSDKLKEFVLDLAIKRHNENDIENDIDKLKKIYLDKNNKRVFRHMVSDVYESLTTIRFKNSDDGYIDILTANISKIRETYSNEKKINIDFLYCLDKLVDHITIEGKRMFYLNNQIVDKATNNSAFSSLKNDVNNVNNTIEKMNKKAVDVIENIESVKVQFVTILGIFSAIVFGFLGEAIFTTSVLNNINKVSPYRLFFAILIIALVFITIIFILCYFISSIVFNHKDDENHKDNVKMRLLYVGKTYWPYFISIFVIIILLVVGYFWWKDGVIEERNIDIYNKYNIATAQEIK